VLDLETGWEATPGGLLVTLPPVWVIVFWLFDLALVPAPKSDLDLPVFPTVPAAAGAAAAAPFFRPALSTLQVLFPLLVTATKLPPPISSSELE
jgi:hypothetical protein